MAAVYKSEIHIPVHKDKRSLHDQHGQRWQQAEQRMEERRQKWQQDFDRMRQDFFKMSPPSGVTASPLTSPGSLPFLTMNSLNPFIERDREGREVFRARFEVSEYQPDEVEVKVQEGKLMVSARHEDYTGRCSVSKQYSRQVDLPSGVDQDQLICLLSRDGTLTVEGPLTPPPSNPTILTLHPIPSPTQPQPPPQFKPQPQFQSQLQAKPQFQPQFQAKPQPQLQAKPQFQPQLQAKPQFQPQFQAKPQPQLQAKPQSPLQANALPQLQAKPQPARTLGVGTPVKNPIVTLPDGSRMMKLTVEVDEFSPDEVHVHASARKLLVRAQHEEKAGGRTVHKGFSKEYDLPESVDTSTITSFLVDNNKTLVIQAPLRPDPPPGRVYDVKRKADLKRVHFDREGSVVIANSSNDMSPVSISIHRG